MASNTVATTSMSESNNEEDNYERVLWTWVRSVARSIESTPSLKLVENQPQGLTTPSPHYRTSAITGSNNPFHNNYDNLHVEWEDVCYIYIPHRPLSAETPKDHVVTERKVREMFMESKKWWGRVAIHPVLKEGDEIVIQIKGIKAGHVPDPATNSQEAYIPPHKRLENDMRNCY